MSDSASEGTWRWLNANRANPDDGSLWNPGYPRTGSSGDNLDCAFAYFTGNDGGGLFVRDELCSHSYQALCEKPI